MMSDTAADPALAQVPVGEEGELERRDRALDRHVDQVHDEPAAVEALERTAERLGSLRCKEGERPLVPARAGEALGLLRLQMHTGGDHEHVVRKHRAVVDQHFVALRPDGLDLVLVGDDALPKLAPPRADDRPRGPARRGRRVGRAGRRAGRRGRRRGSRPRPDRSGDAAGSRSSGRPSRRPGSRSASYSRRASSSHRPAPSRALAPLDPLDELDSGLD